MFLRLALSLCLVTALAVSPTNAGPPPGADIQLLIKASAAEAAGDYARALQIFRHLAHINNNAQRFTDAARISWTLNKPREAQEDLKQALKIDPNCSEALLLQAKIELSEGLADQAKLHVEKAVSADPKNAGAQRLLADLLAHAGLLDNAHPHFVKLLELEPANVHARQNVVAYLASNGKLDEAIKICKAGLKESNSQKLKLELAHLYLQAGKIAEANDTFKAARDPESRDSEPYQMLAITCGARNDWVSALSYAKSFDDIDLHSANAAVLSAWAAYLSFDLLEAKNLLERAVQLTPKDADMRNLYAIVLMDLRRFPAAAEQLLDAEKLAPKDIAVRMNNAMLQLLTGKHADALESATSIAKEYPQLAAAQSLLSYATLLNGQPAQAAKLAREALHIDAGDVLAHAVCAKVLRADKNYDDALAHLKLAQTSAGEMSSFIQSEIAETLLAKGEAAKAASAAQFALQASPSNPEAKHALAKALAVQGNWDGALLYLREISARNPKDLAAKLELGNALINKGDYVAAQLVYEAAQKLAPTSHEVLSGLSKVAEKQGNKRLARKYEKMITRLPHN